MRNLLTEEGEIDPRDFLARADVLAAAGKTVLISDYFEYYRLATYLRRCTPEAIAIVLGAGSLIPLLDEKYYASLGGGILEAFGQLFQKNLTIYVYPWLDPASQKLNTVSNLDVAPELRKLFGFLVDRGAIVQLENYDPQHPPHLHPRGPPPHQEWRRELGGHGAAGNRRGHQAAWVLRLPAWFGLISRRHSTILAASPRHVRPTTA